MALRWRRRDELRRRPQETRKDLKQGYRPGTADANVAGSLVSGACACLSVEQARRAPAAGAATVAGAAADEAARHHCAGLPCDPAVRSCRAILPGDPAGRL
jgi:hypothetical protein